MTRSVPSASDPGTPGTPTPPVPSALAGHPYAVDAVDGHQPDALEDLLGEVDMVLRDGSVTVRVAGVGSQAPGAVDFHQHARGRVVGRWLVTASAGRLVARQIPTR